MSRIGNRTLKIPAGVTATVNENKITVSGPKGELELVYDNRIKVSVVDDTIKVSRTSEIKEVKSLHGTTNANISNLLIGVSEGFSKSLEAVGVGYKFAVAGNKVTINAGYSHPVNLEIPSGLKVEAISNTEITVSGIEKQRVNEFAAIIRKTREPEPYKGKGIRYKGEYIRRKEGKKAAK